jgi:maleate cis-trans isomerase
MTGNEIRQKYLEYMAKNGHAVVPSAALVPDNASVGRAYGVRGRRSVPQAAF